MLVRHHHTSLNYSTELTVPSHLQIAWLFLLVVVDVLITLGVFFFLVHKPKKTSGGLLKTDSRVLSLASIAVKTNLISLLCQVSILALVFAFPKAFHFGSFISSFPP